MDTPENRQLCSLDTDKCLYPATVYCDLCDVYMCEQCELSHKNNRFTRKHESKAVDQVLKREKGTECHKHTSKQLDLFCEDCNTAICSTCLSAEHNKHVCCSLKNKMEEYRGQLDQVLTQTCRSLNSIRTAIKTTQEQAVKVKTDVTEIKQQTSAAYHAVQRHVEEQEERHLANIDEYYQQAEKVIAETLDKQQTLESVLNSTQLHGQNLLKSSVFDMIPNVKSLVKRSEEEVSKSVPELRWKTDLTWFNWDIRGDAERVGLMTGGEVNVENDLQLTTVTGQSVTCGDTDARQLNSFTTLLNDDVTGVLSYNNHLLIVHCQSQGILYVYDKTGKLKSSVQICCQENILYMNAARGICLVKGKSDTQSLVISDSTGTCLWWMTIEKQADDIKLGRAQRHEVKYCPTGVSTDRSGRAVVTDFYDNRVYVYSHPGDYGMCVQLPDGVNPRHFLAEEADECVVIYGMFRNCLAWVNSAGEVTRHYTGELAVCPHHVVDEGTHLLVSDRHNRCVHILTRDGGHSGYLITDIDPTYVCLDPAGRRLWVAHQKREGLTTTTHVIEMPYTPVSLRPTSAFTSTTDSQSTKITLAVNLPKCKT